MALSLCLGNATFFNLHTALCEFTEWVVCYSGAVDQVNSGSSQQPNEATTDEADLSVLDRIGGFV